MKKISMQCINRLILFLCLCFSKNLFAQEVTSYIEKGSLETVYSFINDQCKNDSTAILIISREYFIDGAQINMEEIAKQGTKYIKDYISYNRNRLCTFKRAKQNTELLMDD